jgi:VWFA-related protein
MISRCLLGFTAIVSATQSPADLNTVLRTSTRLVQVNVIVHDKNAPVANLTKDDFILTDRGRPRKIDVFSVESTAGSAKSADPLPPNTFSNRQTGAGSAPPNVVIVLLDGRNTRFEDQANAKRQLIRFLAGVDPKDRIAIYTFSNKLRVLCDFTDSPEARQKILAKFRGSTGSDVIDAHPDPSNTGDAIIDQFVDQSNLTFANAAQSDSAAATLGAFAAIAGHVADLPGRKTLVWLTGSLPMSLAGAAKAFNRANLAVYPVDARGLVGMPGSLTAFAPSARTPPSVAAFRPAGLQTMQELADRTGGRAFYNANDLSGAIRTALEDSSTTYTLGFYLDSQSLDGKFHELKVQVSRPGLSVRYKREYLAAKEAPAPADESERNLSNALESPLESSNVPLEATVGANGESLKISWTIDVHNLQLQQEGDVSNGAVNVFFVQKDETGKVLDMAQEAYDVHVRLKKGDYESYLRTKMTHSKVLELKKDAKTLRILVADRTNGAVGSLIVPLSKVK